MQGGDIEGAARVFAQAIATNANDGKAHGYLGICKVRVGDLTGGIASLTEAVRLQPGDANAYFNLAVAYNQAQMPNEARTCLQYALQLDPNHAKAQAALANLPAAQGQAPPPPPQTQPMYAQQPPAQPGYGQQPPPMYGQQAPSGQGMVYTPPVAQAAVAPPSGTRIARGLGWGALYGQAFTAWTLLRVFMRGTSAAASSAASGAQINAAFAGQAIAIAVVVCALMFAVIGSIIGLIIGSGDMDADKAGVVGIVAAMLVVGLQFALGYRGGVSLIIGIVVYIGIGRYVGQNIAARVHQPVRQ